jgi:hypothetical protein
VSKKWSNLLLISILSALVIALLCAPPASADNLYASIRGTVTDTSGAALPAARVTATNIATGIATQAVTADDGTYVFVQLPIGDYDVKVEKEGFRTFTATRIHLAINQTYVQDARMEVGAVTQEVVVQANPLQVDTSSIQLTATINAATITELPLIGRNWITLQQTLPGVVLPDTRFGTNYSTNGSQAQQNSYLVNGNDNNDIPLNSPQTLPNPDAIAEVRMITNTINPEYGRNSGAIMNAVTKSGTNDFHGTAFEFYRDSFLNTRNYFQNAVPPIHQNQFGGVIGGPIKKDKMFFFYGLQLLRAAVPGANNAGAQTVFTQAQLNGDFSAQLCPGCTADISTNKTPFAVVGSNGTTYPAGTAWNVVFPDTGAGVKGIPTSDFNSTSMTLIKNFVPLPNCGVNQYCFNPITTQKFNQHIGRFDWTPRSSDAIWFYAYANNASVFNDLPFSGSTLPGFGDSSPATTKQFTGAWTHTFSANVLNEFRLGYTRLNFPTGTPQHVRQPKDVGFPDIFPQLASGADYPNIGITGYFSLGGTTNGPQPRKDQTYQLTDNFSIVKGHHTMKFGYDGRRFNVWNPFAARNDGAFSFDPSGIYSTGDAGLDYLLGIPQSYNQESGQIILAQAYEHYAYFQDEWRVTHNLTLTLGTGYQVDTPIAEYQNGGVSRFCFQPGVQSKIFPTAPVGYTMTGDPGCNNYGGTSTYYNHFGPRAGFAYAPDWGWLTGGPGKTSIRAGWGLYYNRSEEELNLQDLGQPPFGLSSNGVADASTTTATYVPSFPDPFKDIATGFSIPNKFPYVASTANAASIDFTQFEPFGPALSGISRSLRPPYAMNWNLTVERQVPGDMIITVAYVASHGDDLLTSYTGNPTTPAGVAACAADPSCVSQRTAQPTLHPDHYVYPGDVWGYFGIQDNRGWSNYDSLQISAEKRMSHGLAFETSYTWAHALDVSSSFEDTAFLTAGGVNPYGGFSRDYGSSAFDARNRFVASFIYDIPDISKEFGFSNFAASRFFGGWKLVGINAMQSGFPVQFQDTNNLSLVCAWNLSFYSCPDRPDLASMPQALDPRSATFGGKTHYFFNPASMKNNALGTMGNVGRGLFDGPAFWNDDFSIQKDIKVTEGTRFELRLEAYNVFNHTNFANPNGNVASGNFGRITAIRTTSNSRLVQLGGKFYF